MCNSNFILPGLSPAVPSLIAAQTNFYCAFTDFDIQLDYN